MIKANVDGFEIRSDKQFLQVGISAMVMGGLGLYFFVPMFFEPIVSSLDVFGVVFMSVWLFVVFVAAILCLYRYSKKIFISEKGVRYSSLFTKKLYKWEEIKDFGLSYDGRTRYGRNNYIFYFANNELKASGADKKKLSLSTLKVHILSDDYLYITETVIPFCSERVNAVPFIPIDKLSFI